MKRFISTLALLFGCVLGALIPLGEISVDAEMLPTCHEGDYALLKRSGAEMMMGLIGKTLVLQGQQGATINISTAHRWAYGFKVYVGNLGGTGTMTVNQNLSVPAGGASIDVTPSLGQTFLVIETDCDDPYTAIASKTVNTQGFVTGLKLNWNNKCNVAVGVKIGSSIMPSVVLTPFNSNGVTGLLGVLPETFSGQVTMTVPGNATTPSLPFAVYTGKWAVQYYFGESSEKIVGSSIFQYSQYLNLGPELSAYPWFGMGYTELDAVRNDTSYTPSASPVAHIMNMGGSVDPEILPHNAFNATFSC